MVNNNLINIKSPEVIDPLTELLRSGARKLLEEAIQAELEEALSAFEGETTSDGRNRVVRSGYQPEREILTGVGKVTVRVPKIRSREGNPESFQSVLVPPYVRKSRSIESAIPWLYLRGVSTGQMQQALATIVGPEAEGLSASVVSRLKHKWKTEYVEWSRRRITGDWVYIWADGIYSHLRGDNGKLCCLVIIGVDSFGKKRFLAIEDGFRESTQSWREVLLSLKSRGLTKAPKLAIGDGALGFFSALSEIYPETRHQRCQMHKTSNVLNYMPSSLREKAKAALHDIWMAEDRTHAEKSFTDFLTRFSPKYPKATQCLEKDRQKLLCFYDFPAEHWCHIRTTNPIESSFSTIRHRSRQTKGCLTRSTMLSMIFKLGQSAEGSWKKLRGFDQLAKVIEGVKFKDGIEVKEEGRAAA